MEPSRELSRLLDKYFEGSCSKEELTELFALMRQADDEQLYRRLRNEWEKSAGSQPASEPDWDRMFSSITGSAGPVRKIRNIWKWAAAAAIIMACMGGGSYLIYLKTLQQQSLPVARVQQQIVPGGNKAVLTLADGSRIILDSAADGLLTRQGNAAIKKDRDGRLVYLSVDNEEETGLPVMNTISTPRGGQYQVDLPDGSTVWLNAASSLKFPASFNGKTRRVELKGEAYFEVARDETRPFLISSGSQTVEVLGTRFNISAYQDEPVMRTTLIEGSVKVELKSGGSRLLDPGQEASTAASGKITVAQAIPGQAIAWKNGKFMFNGESIESIMRKIARWYDVEVIYQGSGEDAYFTGSVSRFSEVTDVLRKLELTGSVHFKIEGRRIIVMP